MQGPPFRGRFLFFKRGSADRNVALRARLAARGAHRIAPLPPLLFGLAILNSILFRSDIVFSFPEREKPHPLLFLSEGNESANLYLLREPVKGCDNHPADALRAHVLHSNQNDTGTSVLRPMYGFYPLNMEILHPAGCHVHIDQDFHA
jgi:hypothetical protein